jgi:hypothetical protein
VSAEHAKVSDGREGMRRWPASTRALRFGRTRRADWANEWTDCPALCSLFLRDRNVCPVALCSVIARCRSRR